MPFYQMPEQWSPLESGLKYTRQEFVERIASNVEAMKLEPGSLEEKIMNTIQFFELDKLFNNAPN